VQINIIKAYLQTATSSKYPTMAVADTNDFTQFRITFLAIFGYYHKLPLPS